MENETTTNKKIDDKDIFIPDIAEKDLIKKSLGINKDTTEEEAIAIFGDDYTIDLVNEEHNYKEIKWNSIETNNNVHITLKNNKCNYKSISIGFDNDITKKTKITEELYYKLKYNLTYDDVKDILGEGILSSVNISGWDDYGNQEIYYNYTWVNENGSGALSISFDRNFKFENITRSNMFKFYE